MNSVHEDEDRDCLLSRSGLSTWHFECRSQKSPCVTEVSLLQLFDEEDVGDQLAGLQGWVDLVTVGPCDGWTS